MKRWLHDHALAVYLFLFGLLLVPLFIYSGWRMFVDENQSHGEQATYDAYVWVALDRFGFDFIAELWGAAVLVMFAAWWIYRKSAESKDSDEEIQRQLRAIQERLNRMNGEP